MRQFGLIGYPLGHSFSKGYFSDKFIAEDIRDCHYENYPLESISEFPELIRSRENLCGLNVTIPYKESVMPYLDDVDEQASVIGAVNTIRFNEGRLTGHNTDAYGFRKCLEPLLEHLVDNPVSALVLGTGGASKAVVYVLDQLEIPYTFVSRRKIRSGLTYGSLTSRKIRTHLLIINTTPLGMFPDIESKPELPYDAIGEEHILFDLVYNPELTSFLAEGQKHGARISNGLKMLEYQAERAWAIWNDF